MARWNSSKWLIYLGVFYCPICHHVGYFYIKLYFNSVVALVVSHRGGGVCYVKDL